MEFHRAYWDEPIDEHLVARHERDIFPILKKRYLFSDVQNFFLYDFYTADGNVNENVFAYSNRVGNERALVLYNNKYDFATGWINLSSAYIENERLIQKSIFDGLALSANPNHFVVFKDHISGLEYLRSITDIQNEGLYFELGAFKYQVFSGFKEVLHADARPYRELANSLQGAGVLSIEEALDEWVFRSILGPLEEAVNPGSINWLLSEAKPDTFSEKMNRINNSFSEFPEALPLNIKQLNSIKQNYLGLLKLASLKKSII